MLSLILLIAAFVMFCVAAASVPTGRVNMVGLGLALWVLSQLVQHAPLN